MIPNVRLALIFGATLLAPLAIAQSTPMPTQTARIEGQIINANTGEPLKKAGVRLNPNFQPSANGSTPTAYTIVTEADGKFAIDDIAPGTYTLSASRTGFVTQNYGSRAPGVNPTPLKLDSGQEIKGIAIKLLPQAMIYGRVVDEDGEPVPNAQIRPARWTFSNGKKTLQPTGFGNSQADGTFVIGSLNGGRYYLSAERIENNFSGVEERSANKAAGHESYIRTYFPNALDVETAAPLELAAGAEARGIEIHLRKARVYEIRGTVANTVGGPLSEYMQLMLSPKGSNDYAVFDGGRNMAQVPPKTARFQFKNVLPGTYIIRTQSASVTARDASGDITRIRQLVGRAEVTVGDHDVEGIVFSIGTGVDISGKFTTEGGAQQQPQNSGAAPNGSPSSQSNASQTTGDTQRPTVGLRPTQGLNFGQTSAQASDDGTFRIRGIGPEVFAVNVYGLADGTYLKSVRFGGQDITGKDLDLTSGSPGELEILLSPNAADVSGIVRSSDGQTVASARVQMIDKDKKVAGAATTDQNGAFHITGLAPGEYQVFAWESTGEGVITDPDFRKAFDGQAAPIKLSEKSHQNLDAQLIPMAAMEAEAAKVR
jgi:hypothetical protein